MHTYVYCKSRYDNRSMANYGWIYQKVIVYIHTYIYMHPYIHNGILCSYKKWWHFVTCYSIDGTSKCYVGWMKWVRRKGKDTNDFSHICDIKLHIKGIADF